MYLMESNYSQVGQKHISGKGHDHYKSKTLEK